MPSESPPTWTGGSNAQAAWAEFFASVGLVGLVGVALAAAGVPLLAGQAAVVGGCSLAVVALAAAYQLATGTESPPLAVLTRVQSSSTAASLPTRLRWV
ncbi:hypothetical protein [Salinirarus marinus]|uniref:hypothetical protein n=1 Tax=Salinirarus marinus TaxID=3068310 RepID=UPI003C6C9B3C